MQFKFVAEDLSYSGDAGSGGSLVEAAIDDFLIQVFSDSQCLSGDFNEDGLLNVLDIVSMVNFILGSMEDIEDYLCFGDINGDSLIDILDVISLINLILE